VVFVIGVNSEGLSISSQTLTALGKRGIVFGLDIYGPDEETKIV
jgi:hypothetical protein